MGEIVHTDRFCIERMAKAYLKIMAAVLRSIENAIRSFGWLQLWSAAGNPECIHRPVFSFHAHHKVKPICEYLAKHVAD